MSITSRMCLAACTALVFLSASRRPAMAETNAPSDATDAVAEVAKLMRQAETFEQGGDKLKAARLYERIAKRNVSARRPLANRLSRLYAESGVTNKAVEWAEEVMKVHPDPQAFLAGIQSTLGNYEEAAKILRKQLDVAPSRQRRMIVLWQLGEVYDRQGKAGDARKAFEQAVREATNDAERNAAQKRLEKFIDAQRAKDKSSAKPAAPASKKEPVAPVKSGG